MNGASGKICPDKGGVNDALTPNGQPRCARDRAKVLDYSLEFPTHGQTRVSNELKRKGVILSPGGVRSIWLRHKLEKRGLRLKRLEKWAAANTGVLTETQVQALEDAREVWQGHLEA